MLSIPQISADNLSELRVLQETSAQTVEGRCKSGNSDRQEGPARPENTVGFAQCLDPVRPVG